MATQRNFSIPDSFVILAKELGEDPEKVLNTFVRDWVRSRQSHGEFVPWPEAIRLGVQHGRGWTQEPSIRNWVLRWNTEHPEGDPLHIRRRYRQVHRDDFIRALEASKR